jgi:hypothetical protein
VLLRRRSWPSTQAWRCPVDLAGYLERHGVAHGDIQNENVIIANDGLRLIDYDGMFVPGMEIGNGAEIGQKHFQHPGRTTKQFGPLMDRFSFIVLNVSLEALAADDSLHRRFREGGLAIIFKANDFADPASSDVFRILQGMSALRDSAAKLSAVYAAPVSMVPSLADFIAGRNIPVTIPIPAGRIAQPITPPAYIGAYSVLDAADFAAVVRRVGDRVELVGRIASVFRGIGRRGRGRGKPCIFINFGIWNKESVKVTIWSEGLVSMAAPPTESWIGKWISVTGLVEPPYNGNHYGKLYRNVGITVVSDNQIVHITEKDASFRLGRGGSGDAPTRPSSEAKSSNKDILWNLGHNNRIDSTSHNLRATKHALPQHRQQSPASTVRTKNSAILAALQASTGATSQSHSPPSILVPPPSAKDRLWSRVPVWFWVVVAVVLFLFFVQR